MNSTSKEPAWLAYVPAGIRRRIVGRQLLQVVAGNAGWLIADKLLRMGFGLVVGVWVARYLGPAHFGLLNFAIAFVALFSILSNLGLQGLIVRELVNAAGRRDELIGSALLLRVIGAALAVLLAAVTISGMRPGDEMSLRVVLVVALMLVPQAWDVIDFDFQSRMANRPIVLIRSSAFLICSIVKVWLILQGVGLIGFAWVTTLEFALAALVMNIYAFHDRCVPRLANATWSEMKRLLMIGWPLIVTSLSVILYMRIDQVMLGQLIGDDGVGLFSAAVRVSEVWYFVPVAIGNATAPALTEVFKRSRGEYLQKLLEINRFMIILGAVAAACLTAFSKQIVLFLYGPQYLGAAAVLSVHAWAGVFVAVGVISSAWFVNTGHLRYSMYQTLMGIALNVALNMVLIPRYAGMGAAIATVVSQVFVAVFFNALTAETRELFYLQIRAVGLRFRQAV